MNARCAIEDVRVNKANRKSSEGDREIEIYISRYRFSTLYTADAERHSDMVLLSDYQIIGNELHVINVRL